MTKGMADTFLNAPFRRPCLVALAAAALAACAAPADRQLGETGDALTPASISIWPRAAVCRTRARM